MPNKRNRKAWNTDTHCTVYNDARRVSRVWQNAYFNAPRNMSHADKKKMADAAWA